MRLAEFLAPFGLQKSWCLHQVLRSSVGKPHRRCRSVGRRLELGDVVMRNFAHWVLVSAAAGVVSTSGMDTLRWLVVNSSRVTVRRSCQCLLAALRKRYSYGNMAATSPRLQFGLRRSSVTHESCCDELHVHLPVPLRRFVSVSSAAAPPYRRCVLLRRSSISEALARADC